ncbi:MAG: NAD-dependent epimerase/dehydratase family protein [Alphaproteobacteria bacterium]|nr:NAD-dependent epimerase/dehydratase family protein [Alphaproteobacteria bacterium]
MAVNNYKNILVTGGAGFVGSNIAIMLKREHGRANVFAFDNLKRRGSELTLPRLRKAGVGFVHGDIRCPEDLAAVDGFDLLIDCAAEPSVHAGYDGDPRYLINTNLTGTFNALEAARRHRADTVFLSSSRVYPIAALRNLPLIEKKNRLVIAPGKKGVGWSARGISDEFPICGVRSLYGATKLAAEMLVQEYAAAYGMRAVINRCGVLTGPWQMGKVDQGFIVLWAARHLYGGKLSYSGFGGKGMQVRDILHVADLYDLIACQLRNLNKLNGMVFNAGGGQDISVSLRELTDLCASRGKKISVRADKKTRPADIPYYVTDNAAVTKATGWKPKRKVSVILDEIFAWLEKDRAILEPILK